MEPALVGSALIAAVLLYYASKRFNLRELMSPTLVFVAAFLALMLGYKAWEKYQFNPSFDGTDYVVTIARSGGSFALPVYFNDQEVRGIIDTGATNIVIPYDYADRIGVDMQALNFNQPVSTANGTTNVAYAQVASLRVGDTVIFQNVDVFVSSQGELNAPLMGLDFLNRTSSYSVSEGTMELRFPR